MGHHAKGTLWNSIYQRDWYAVAYGVIIFAGPVNLRRTLPQATKLNSLQCDDRLAPLA